MGSKHGLYDGLHDGVVGPPVVLTQLRVHSLAKHLHSLGYGDCVREVEHYVGRETEDPRHYCGSPQKHNILPQVSTVYATMPFRYMGSWSSNHKIPLHRCSTPQKFQFNV